MAIKTEIDELPNRIRQWEKHVDENLVEAEREGRREYALKYEDQYVGEVHYDDKLVIIESHLEDHAKYAYPEFSVETISA